MPRELTPAERAWVTRRSPVYRARATARRSQIALVSWAQRHGWKLVFLDALSGHPRTGIVDAVLIRIRPRLPDQIDIRLVQLKSGVAGLTAREIDRICRAAKAIQVEAHAAFFNGDDVRVIQVPDEAAATAPLKKMRRRQRGPTG